MHNVINKSSYKIQLKIIKHVAQYITITIATTVRKIIKGWMWLKAFDMIDWPF